MSAFVKLFISGLVALHQYIPPEEPGFKKYYSDVRELNKEEVLFAANQSCQYLFLVSKKAGLESLGDSALGAFAESLLNNTQGIETMIGLIDTPEATEKLVEKGINPKQFKSLISRLCSSQFDPMLFPQDFNDEIYQFIQSEINVLSEPQMQGLGDFQFFGGLTIFDRNKNPINFYGSLDRKWVPYPNMGKALPLALLATEDDQFFSHNGVQAKAVARIAKEAISGDDASGGSTITMQLLKNLFFAGWKNSSIEELNQGRSQDLLRKVREWYWAKPFEKFWAKQGHPKEKILELYFNLVNFGRNIQGVGQASQFYFSKQPHELTLPEAAYLTSLLKRPAFYSEPINYQAWTKPRRDNYILPRVAQICNSPTDQASATGALTLVDLCKANQADQLNAEQLQSLQSAPLPLWKNFELADPEGITKNFAMPDSPEGNPEKLDITLIPEEDTSGEPHSLDAFSPILYQTRNILKQQIADQPGLHRELKVLTTINPQLQEIVHEVVRKKLDQYDQARDSRKYLTAAVDDRGNRAVIGPEDLGISLSYNIHRFTRNNWTHEQAVLYAVGLDTVDLSKTTLSFSEVSEALKQVRKEFSPLEVTDILNQVQRASRGLGYVQFIVIEKDKVQLLDVEQMITWKDFDEELSVEFRDYYSTQKVQEGLLSNAAARLMRSSPRNDFDLLIWLKADHLIDQNLQKASLSQTDARWANNLSQRQLTFFWAKKSSSTEASNFYKLETPKLQAAVLVVDSRSGEVLANFAGYEPEKSYYDRSFLMQRPYGSSLKPWVYYLAFENGLHTYTQLNNRYVSFYYDSDKPPYTPQNYSGGSEWVTLEDAMVHSYNIATFDLFNAYGWTYNPDWQSRLNQLRELLQDVGIYDHAENHMPIVLGAQVSTLQRLVDSFTYFANGKEIKKSFFFDSLEDYFGNNLYQHQPETVSVPNQDPQSLTETQYLLAGVANRGTAAGLRGFLSRLQKGQYRSTCFRDLPRFGEQDCFGGKTGTSNEERDAWFTGFSKNFVIGVWVGYDDYRPIPGKATGGSLALPIFMDIVAKGIKELPPIEPFLTERWSRFDSRQNDNFISIDTNFNGNLSINTLNGCYCDPLYSNGVKVGYKIKDPVIPGFIGETYNSAAECLRAKDVLYARGVLACY